MGKLLLKALLGAGLISILPAAASATSGQGLEISPAVIELTADPGQSVTANIQVRNVTNVNVLTSGTADDFGAAGEEGEPKLLLDEKESGPYSLKFWVNDVPDLKLVPREVKTAKIQINVPGNAEPGGHYGVIRFTATPTDLAPGQSGVSLSASVGALILLKVNGAIKEQLSVAEFYASKHAYKHHFFENGPIDLTERIKNSGSIHEKPTGSVAIYNTFGRKVANLGVNSPPRNVLPASIRKFQQTWNKHFLFGRYKAKLALTYSNGKTLNSTLVFWVIPWRLIIVILIVVAAVVLVGRWGLRRYNRMIIQRAKK